MTEDVDVFAAFHAFRDAMEGANAGYRVEIRYFEPRYRRLVTYEASLWGDVAEEDGPQTVRDNPGGREA